MASLLTGTPASSTTVGSTQLPPWLSSYWTQLLGQAVPVAAEPYTPAPMPRIAPFTPTQERAQELATGFGERAAPLFGQGVEAAGRAATPFGGMTSLQPFMDPYIESVLAPTQARALERLQESVAGTQSPFIGTGGGLSARAMAAMGRTTTEGLRDIAEQEARLRSAGFQGALGAYGQEQARQLAAAQALPQLAQAGVSQMGQVGALQQALGQQSLQTAYQDFLRQQQYPREMLTWLAGLPKGSLGETSTKTTAEIPAGPSGVEAAGSIFDILGGIYQLGQRRGGHIRYRRGGPAVPFVHRARGGRVYPRGALSAYRRAA